MAKIPINIATGEIDQQDVIVGIDLGTTNSLVAYIENETNTVVKDPQGSNTLMPSVVHFDPEDQVIVGDKAKAKLIEQPERTIYSVKRLMGKSFLDVQSIQHEYGYQIIQDEDENSLVKIRVGNRFYNPIQLSAEILKELKERVETHLRKLVTKAVITVPAYFNDAQRQATRDAGKLAGLEVLRIINEPTAASLAYGLDKISEESQNIAVYDLGGGTFDISILTMHNGIFEVLATHGDTFLGGDDFDRAIINYWIDSGQLEQPALDQDSSFRQAIRLAAEEAKKQLSSIDEFNIEVKNYHLNIDKQTFTSIISSLIDRTISSASKALTDSGLKKEDIDHVVLVGGSTRVPAVKNAVQQFFNKVPYDKIDPDEVVARGAAIQANILAGHNKDILLLDVTPLSLGIETVGGLMDVIIPRNSKVPMRAGRQYTTSVDGQKNLKISVYQGERDLVEHNRKLGEFILRDIPPMPAGLPKIEIHFILNADGILQVKAMELRSNVEQSIEIRSQYGISEEEMARMLMDSIQHAQDDMATKALVEARNEADYVLLAADKFINQNQSWLSDHQIDQLRQLKSQLVTKVDNGSKDEIQSAIEEINDYTKPLAQQAMDATISEALSGKKIN